MKLKEICSTCKSWKYSERHKKENKGSCSSKKRKKEKYLPEYVEYITFHDSTCEHWEG